ncbi:WD40-repeat-containing domain protein [Mycena albidolilacea]|uniref:WD40-repeat-containing domain protein n=1 Tax=Mycena albidolilacea TaxID=1033008 RepID=A0AAD7EAH7_9AGAR|nr:WD40-repeat-containing domain protein [Mycena albidolilacea]
MASVIDVDAIQDAKPPIKRPVSPTPILISDDEDIEFIAITPAPAAHIRSSSKGGQSRAASTSTKRPMPVAPGSRLATPTTAPNSKPLRNAMSVASGSRPGSSKPLGNDSSSAQPVKKTYRGPSSSIKLDSPIVKDKKEKRRPKVEPEGSDDDYEPMFSYELGCGTIFEETDSEVEPPEDKRLKNKRLKTLKYTPRLEAPEETVEELIDPRPPRKRAYVDISADHPLSARNSSPDYYVWDALREFKILPHFRPRPTFLSEKRPRLDVALDMDRYREVHRFRRTGGSINKIIQHNGRVVVCSNSAGGDTIGETDPYNKPGTLISWCKSDPSEILDLEQAERDNIFKTHYTVHSAAYDPTSNILASSGADKCVRIWDFDENIKAQPYSQDSDENNEPQPYSQRQPITYDIQSRRASPHEVVFKPGESILAVGEERLTIEDLSEEDGPSHSFDLVGKKHRGAHTTGAIAWGCGSSSSLILASSEPARSNTTHDGSHHAFDIDAFASAFKLDATEAGDALCLDSTGDTAALVTTDCVNSFLRIYDIRNKNSVASQTICLEPFTSASEGAEVNSMMFSPDGIYLALARDDNRTHVYDSRMLKRRGMLEKRGVLYDFKHAETRFSATGQKSFGVVSVKWVQTRASRLGLVTGGNDGCIRLWDPLRGSAEGEGKVLMQASADVAHFTLGDRFSGEHDLVVGDSDGDVYILDRLADMSVE